MIRYALACEAGHRFDSWFRDSDAFAEQSAQSLVLCPDCGSHRVAKAIMAPAVAAGGSMTSAIPDPNGGQPPLEHRHDRARAMLKTLREKVMAETHDVGPRFATEARDMHEGETPHRPIRGQATVEEVKGLLRDGVPILPLPIAPDDLN